MSSSKSVDSKKALRKFPKQVLMKTTAKYKVPKSVFEKAKKQLSVAYNSNDNRFKCHQTSFFKLNGIKPPSCRSNLLEAAKQAMVSS